MKQMKKLCLTLLIIFMSLQLFATSLSNAGVTTGGTMKDEAFLLGVSYSTVQTADYSRNFGMGLGIHLNISFLVADNETNGLFGALVGPCLEIRPLDKLSIAFVFGPAMVAESGSFGIGGGLDFSVSWFFNDTFGVSIGGTAYPQFYINDDKRDTDFSFAGGGYVGLSWRKKTYSWDENVTFGPEKR